MHEASGREPRAQLSPQHPLRASQGSARCSRSVSAVCLLLVLLGSGVALAEQPPDAAARAGGPHRRARAHGEGARRRARAHARGRHRARGGGAREPVRARAGGLEGLRRWRGASRSAATPRASIRTSITTRTARTDNTDMLRAVLYTGYKFNEQIVFNTEIEFEHGTTERDQELGRRQRLGRVRDARLLLASVGQRARRPAADSDGLHQPDPRAALLLRRAPPRGRAPADSDHLARERDGRVRRSIGELIDYQLYVTNGLNAEGYDASGDPRRPPARQPRAGRGRRLHRPRSTSRRCPGCWSARRRSSATPGRTRASP